MHGTVAAAASHALAIHAFVGHSFVKLHVALQSTVLFTTEWGQPNKVRTHYEPFAAGVAANHLRSRHSERHDGFGASRYRASRMPISWPLTGSSRLTSTSFQSAPTCFQTVCQRVNTRLIMSP